MTTRFRDLDTGEDMVFLPTGGFKRNGFSYARNHLNLATPQELANLNIEAYEYTPPDPPPPSTDPVDYPLEPFQFFAMLEILGKTDAVNTAIDAIPDATQKAVAKAKFQHMQLFERDDPLFSSLAPVVGLTDAQIDAAWMTAKDIT